MCMFCPGKVWLGLWGFEQQLAARRAVSPACLPHRQPSLSSPRHTNAGGTGRCCSAADPPVRWPRLLSSASILSIHSAAHDAALAVVEGGPLGDWAAAASSMAARSSWRGRRARNRRCVAGGAAACAGAAAAAAAAPSSLELVMDMVSSSAALLVAAWWELGVCFGWLVGWWR